MGSAQNSTGNDLVPSLIGCAKLNPLRPHNMEAFLASLADLIGESELLAIELIGALEIAKADLLNDLFTTDEDAE